MKAWPFLVSRNQSIDYRTIVCPKFIYNVGIHNILARTTEGELSEDKNAFIRIIKSREISPFTIVYQVFKATEKDININTQGENTLLKDSFGREIYLIKGFVLNGEHSDINFYKNNIEEAYKNSIEGYREFWQSTDSYFTVTSEAFDLIKGSEEDKLKLILLDTFHTEPPELEQVIEPVPSINPRKTIITALAVIAPIIVIAFLVFLLNIIKGQDNLIDVYKKNLANNHITYVQFTGETIDVSDASRRYWIIGKEGENFIFTNNSKSIYKTNDQITINKLIPVFDDLIPSSIKEETIKLNNNEEPKKLLKQQQNQYKNADIYISGSLQVKSPAKPKQIKLKSNQYQTITINQSTIKMNYHPIEEAIIQLENQKVTGTVTLTIIQPKPKL